MLMYRSGQVGINWGISAVACHRRGRSQTIWQVKFKYNLAMTTWDERITVDANVLVGKPVIKGTRLSVDFIIDLLAQGWSFEDILLNYPGVQAEDIRACLAYASGVVRREKMYTLPMA